MKGHGEFELSSREQFIANVRRALGRKMGDEPGPPPELDAMAGDAASAEELATAALQEAEAKAGELMAELEESAAQIGWTVARVRSAEGAAQYVETLAAELEARSVVRSAHEAVEELRLEDRLAGKDISVGMLVLDEDNDEQAGGKRETWRSLVLQADIGVTGVDYAIAETGSCVVQARKGVSRLVSLTPPVHVAVVRYGQIRTGAVGPGRSLRHISVGALTRRRRGVHEHHLRAQQVGRHRADHRGRRARPPGGPHGAGGVGGLSALYPPDRSGAGIFERHLFDELSNCLDCQVPRQVMR